MPKVKRFDGVMIPRTVEMLNTTERANFLVKIPGTRAHARAILEANKPHPFG
jgi:hypothetical protein